MERDMSVRERQAWIAISCTLVIWGYYFSAFGLDVASARLHGSDILFRFIACMVVSVVVMCGLAIVTGIVSKTNFDAPPDEMARMIEAHADRIGFRVLETIIPLGLIGALLSTGNIAAAFPADPAGSTGMIFANAVLFLIVVTELVRESVHIIGFRMSA